MYQTIYALKLSLRFGNLQQISHKFTNLKSVILLCIYSVYKVINFNILSIYLTLSVQD